MSASGNQGVNGTFRVVSFELRYKKDEQWQTSHSYGASDLIFLENVAKSMTLATEKNGFHRGCHPRWRDDCGYSVSAGEVDWFGVRNAFWADAYRDTYPISDRVYS